MKQQTAKKRAPSRTKTAKAKSKSVKSHSGSWRIIGEWYVAVPLSVLVVLAAGYIARGWIRYHAEPAMVSWSVDDTKKVLKQQSDELHDPLQLMGISQRTDTGRCLLIYANGIASNFFCGHAYMGSLSDVRNLKPSLTDRSAALETSLRAGGWSRGATDLTTLGGNIDKGVDSTPDAAYSKSIGAYTCVIDFSTAFSKPKPPAIFGDLACSRSYDVFGSTPYGKMNS